MFDQKKWFLFAIYKKKKKKKKTTFVVKFDIKNGFCNSFPFQKCILLYTLQ